MTDNKIKMMRIFLWISLMVFATMLFVSSFSEARIVKSGPWSIIETLTMKIEGSTITEKNAGTITIESSNLDVNSPMSVQGPLIAESTLSVTEGSTLQSSVLIQGQLDVTNGLSKFGSTGPLRINELERNDSLAVFAFGIGGVGLYSGNAFSGDSSLIGEAVAMSVQTSDESTIGTSPLSVNTGAYYGTGASNTGPLTLSSGWNVNALASGVTGNTNLLSGSNFGTGDSGTVAVASGNTDDGNSGGMFLNTGNSTSGNSGSFTMGSGDALSGQSGDLLLKVGNATTGGAIVLDTDIAGTDGDIRFQDGSQGTVGHVWTQTDISGTGSWSPAPAGGNTWSDPVDSNIIPDGDATRDIGSGSFRFNNIYTKSLFLKDNNAYFAIEDTAGATATQTFLSAAGSLNYGRPINYSVVTEIGYNSTKNYGLLSYGKIDLFTYDNDAVGSGDWYAGSGNSGGANNNSGSLFLSSGNATGTGTSGDVSLTIGTGGTQGDFKFLKTGAAPTVGDVWTATGVDGSGYWSAPVGGGGDLWSDPLDSNIIPDTDTLRNIGSATKRIFILDARLVRNSANNQYYSDSAPLGYSAGTYRGDMGSSTGAGFNTPSGQNDILNIRGATNNQASSHPIALTTRNSSGGVEASGTIFIETGNSAASATTGNIDLRTGTTAGTRGKIRMIDGSQGTAGHVWTSTDANGAGAWTAPATLSKTKIYNNATAQTFSSLSASAAQFDTVKYDNVSAANLANNRIDILKDSFYTVKGEVCMTGLAGTADSVMNGYIRQWDDSAAGIVIRSRGYASFHTLGSGAVCVQISFDEFLETNDYIEIQGYNGDSISHDAVLGETWNWLSVVELK